MNPTELNRLRPYLKDYKDLYQVSWIEAISDDRKTLKRLQAAYDIMKGQNTILGHVCRPECKEALEAIKFCIDGQKTLFL